jgi:ABC-type polysaccharide/polyol phosphate export permease
MKSSVYIKGFIGFIATLVVFPFILLRIFGTPTQSVISLVIIVTVLTATIIGCTVYLSSLITVYYKDLKGIK